MANANLYQAPGNHVDYTPVAAVTAGDVLVFIDGRAGFAPTAIAAGVKGMLQVCGICTVTKPTGEVYLEGQPLYWDHSANATTYTPASDEDFYLGCVVYGDAASTDLTVEVNLNVWPEYKIDINRGTNADGCVAALVETTAGAVTVYKIGGSHRLAFSTATEAGKADILSDQSFTIASDWIVEGAFRWVDDGDDAALDFNVGVANATHATDADSITESVFLHTDGNVLNILAESDDGTTEVAATDTTVDYALNATSHFMIDGRDTTDIQIYIDGDLVLGGSTFTLTDATGPMKLLVHMEKTSNNTSAELYIPYLRVRCADL